MPKAEFGYHLLLIGREYLSGWAEARPLKQGTLEKVADFIYQELIVKSGSQKVW